MPGVHPELGGTGQDQVSGAFFAKPFPRSSTITAGLAGIGANRRALRLSTGQHPQKAAFVPMGAGEDMVLGHISQVPSEVPELQQVDVTASNGRPQDPLQWDTARHVGAVGGLRDCSSEHRVTSFS